MTELTIDRAPGNLLLSGVVGSKAYGLDHPGSDVDRLGMYASPTVSFHGLRPPIGDRDTVVIKSPSDAVYHEALKYVRLVMKGNPSVTELLWLDAYEVVTPLGMFLVNRRTRLLSAPRIRASYLGYATSQFQRLFNRGDGSFSADTRKRTAKHARHLLRLLHQGLDLYRVGHLTIKVSEPYRYFEFGDAVARFDGTDDWQKGADIAKAELTKTEEAFDRSVSPLRPEPDEILVESWLRAVRLKYWANSFSFPKGPIGE
jgi:uncharacterized protein